MALAAAVATVRALSSTLASLVQQAVVLAAALPLDCQLALSQTAHICAGWAPPVSFVPGCGPFGVCWIWFGLGVLFGVVMCLLVWHMWVVQRSHVMRSMHLQTTTDPRVELLQLLVAGGQDVLQDLAQQCGVSPVQFLQQCVQAESGRIRPSTSRSVGGSQY